MKKLKKLVSVVCAFSLLVGLAALAPTAAALETPQWVEKATLPKMVYNFSAETIGKTIYTFGGVGGSGESYKVYAYDTAADQWSIKYEIPSSYDRFDYASLMVDGKMYIFGGRNTLNTSDGTRTTLIYDPATNTIHEGAEMSTERARFKVFAVGEKIYAMGGQHGVNNAAVSTLQSVEIYNPASDTWTAGDNMPVRLCGYAGAVVQDKIYIFGGEDSISTYVYDTVSGTWETKAEVPEVNRYFGYAEAVAVGDEIYVLGGKSNVELNTVKIYNPASDTWRDGPAMQHGRYNFAMTTVDDVIYAIAGYPLTVSVEALNVAPESKKLAVLLNPEEQVQLSVSNRPSDNLELTWTSSNAEVATVDGAGKVTAVAPGLCDITAANEDGTFRQSIPVRVLPGTADQFRLAVNLKAEEHAKLYLTADPADTSWESLDAAVATIDAAGRVTAVSAGLCVIEGTSQEEVYQIYVRVGG